MTKIITLVYLTLGLAACANNTHCTSTQCKAEMQTRPACVSITEDEKWSECMRKFKDIRPHYTPTNLIFKDGDYR